MGAADRRGLQREQSGRRCGHQVPPSEPGPRKIRVNAINPGLVETEGTHAVGVADADSEFRKEAERTTPLGRIRQPDDIAAVAVLLASPAAAWVTGETLRAAGVGA